MQTQSVHQKEIQNTGSHQHDKAAASHTQNTTLSPHEQHRQEQEHARETHEHAEKLVKDAESA